VLILAPGTCICSKAQPLSNEICEHFARQTSGRDSECPRGDIAWPMYLRLAEELDPKFKN